MLAANPRPPYYAVIFTSILKNPAKGYEKMSDRMVDLAEQQPGFIGFESAREETGITISYWKDEASIKKWKNHFEHQIAQDQGKQDWYQSYIVRVCKVERSYDYQS